MHTVLRKSVRRRLQSVLTAVARLNKNTFRTFSADISNEFAQNKEVVPQPVDLCIVEDRILRDEYVTQELLERDYSRYCLTSAPTVLYEALSFPQIGHFRPFWIYCEFLKRESALN